MDLLFSGFIAPFLVFSDYVMLLFRWLFRMSSWRSFVTLLILTSIVFFRFLVSTEKYSLGQLTLKRNAVDVESPPVNDFRRRAEEGGVVDETQDEIDVLVQQIDNGLDLMEKKMMGEREEKKEGEDARILWRAH
ncbi:hypothetical protein CAPTEDRAFT_198759 [Capitella teleta]|uniref:Uncharacterized protein n=1 Tax=Capitella teleta TaxID=283909 RepID=R7V864_CAPTE|nr:hypothetical protein CAPTEDRAFT_198759 [Capitella teleta]|eukprot:ELU14667.1 hypothetical protein CAPTEDRAFT_198759 [Capitella teleta]